MNCSAMTDTETDNDYDHNRVDNRKAQAGTNMNSGMMSNNASIELKVVKPVEYDSVTLIADHLLNHRTVYLIWKIPTRKRHVG